MLSARHAAVFAGPAVTTHSRISQRDQGNRDRRGGQCVYRTTYDIGRVVPHLAGMRAH